jgi:hypothetical protein
MAYDEIVMQDGSQPEGDMPTAQPEGGEGASEDASPTAEGEEVSA